MPTSCAMSYPTYCEVQSSTHRMVTIAFWFVLLVRRYVRKRAIGVQDVLTTILQPSRLTAIVDIGANLIEGEPSYKAMLEAGLCEVIGFEPQPEALATLRESATAKETYLPYVVADGQEGTLRICKAPGMTSLLEPDPRQLALFNLFPNFGTILEEWKIDTIRLDDIKEISELDFLKIDIQGSELTVFSNGKEVAGRSGCRTNRGFLYSSLRGAANVRPS